MLKKVLIFSVGCSFILSSASAGIIDPTPLFSNVSESPHEEPFFREPHQDFFCPLFKKFYNDPDEIAVQTIILEALGEGYEGMVAVGEVIRNRSKLFPKDFTGICLMPKQFSCWNDEAKAREFLRKYREYYFVAMTAWKNSETSRLTGGATDYHAASIHPYWAGAYRVAARIGNHIFYVRK